MPQETETEVLTDTLTDTLVKGSKQEAIPPGSQRIADQDGNLFISPDGDYFLLF